MTTKKTSEDILLGYGVVKINGSPLGLTRGGSAFAIERDVRNIEADGDRGPVGGRIVIDTEVAKLTVNALEMFTLEETNKYFSGTKKVGTKLESSFVFAQTDYVTVTWTGKTLGGKAVVITLNKALNMENLDITLEDKNEVVPELVFTAVYEEGKMDESTWSIDYPTDAPIGGGE